MNIDFLKNYLRILNFKLENGSDNLFFTTFKDYKISVSIDKEKIEKSIINYGDKIIIHRQTTTNLSQAENLVVLECVCRLLEKGYSPESIELEKSWNLGHQGKGFLDILVKDKDDKSLFMIECKNWGEDIKKERDKMLKDGGQLLSYFRQDRKVKALCLYASKVENDKIDCISKIIDTKILESGSNDEEIFELWDKEFLENGIFEDNVNCYEFKKVPLTYGRLREIKKADGTEIFHKFASILRRHSVSDKSNAFNKIFNLFLCKIHDEDFSKEKNKELRFQYKKDETKEEFIDRLHTLYKDSILEYIKIEIDLMTQKDLKEGLTEDKKNKLLYYNNNKIFEFKDYSNQESFYENAEVVKEVVELLEKYQMRYETKHQYLGDFFELLLNTGFKQESGQFFTPIPLTRFICKSLPIEKIINQKLQNEINFLPYVIDYASGSGHFITEMMDEIDFYVQKIKDDQIELGKRAIDKFERKSLKWAKRYIYAIEKDHRLVKISKVSSFLHGDGDANVILSNGLAPFSSEKYNLGEDRVLYSRDRNAAENNVFDIVVANPPYSVDNFAKESFKEYQKQGLKPENYFDLYQYLTSNSSEIECLFIERTKQLMKDGAVAGIVLPISILTNGGIYEKTREIILNHFNIKAIVSLGSNAFMATGTKTIILFLEKRPIGEFNETKKVVNEFLTHFKDVACGGFANAFSIYARNVYEMDFEDYISILQNKPTEKANTSEMMKEYKTLSHKEIIELEREKLIYFTTVYSQKIVLADSGEKDIEKEFYGYEFSNRRGHEGIHIYKDEEGKINSKLYNEDFAELEDKNKLNSYILRNFNYDKHLESEITEIQTSENHPLKNHIHFVRFSQLMSFDLKRFDKSVNLNKKNNLKIESKWELVKLGDEKLFKLYQPKTITSDEILRDGKYKVYGANGVIGFYNEYNHENSEIAITCRGATCGTINYTEPKSWITGNAMICQIIDKEKINQLYIKALLQNTNLKSTITGTAQPQITRETLSPFKLPLPPLEIQEKIVSEIGEIEKKEERVRGLIERNEQKINGLFGNAKNVKEITISEIAKSLTAGGDVPKESFSTKKTEKYQIPIYANGYQNKGLYGYTDIIKIDEPCITISARGTIGYSETRTEPFYPIVRLICLIPKEEIANIFYLKYLLNKTQFINSGTTTPQLTVPQISGIKLSLPPLSEQQKIIAQIEPLEKEVAEAKEFLASIKDLKNEVLMRYL